MTNQSSKAINLHNQADGENFQTSEVLTISSGHFIHDSFTGMLPALLPIIQERLGSSYSGTGGLIIFTQLPSLLTPFIGYLADRVSVRYFVILAPAITATLIGMIGLANVYFMLALLLLVTGISVASFHAPAPAMIARMAGNQVGKGMSIFMAAGELGRTVGPLVAIAGVAWWSIGGMWRISLVGWLASAILYWRLRDIAAQSKPVTGSEFWSILPKMRSLFSILVWLMLPRYFMLAGLTIYLPTFMNDQVETNLWWAAGALTLLEGAGVVGALYTGTVSDRIGRGRMLLILLSIAPILMLAFIYSASSTWLAALLLIGLGLTAISPTPVLLALVQDQFPDIRATANGIFMLCNFVLRAIAIWGLGLLSDQFGLFTAFQISVVLALISIPATFWIPSNTTMATD